MKKIYVTSECPVARVGDRMKTVISCFIFAELLNAEIISNESWSTFKSFQSFINNAHEKKGLDKMDFNPIISQKTYDSFFQKKINNKYETITIEDKNYKGYTYKEFLGIKEQVDNAKSDCVLLLFKGVCRINLYDLLEWEKGSKIESGSCERLIKLLRKLYFSEKNGPQKIEDLVCIHIRRGDMISNPRYSKTANKMLKRDFKYYQLLIRHINREYKNKNKTPTIEIHTEIIGSEDLCKLSEEENTKIIKGGYSENNSSDSIDQFHRLCIAEQFYMYNSGFSTLASYLNPNNIFVPHFVHKKNFLKLNNFKTLPLFNDSWPLFYRNYTVSSEMKYIWIRIPKCASSSILPFLQKNSTITTDWVGTIPDSTLQTYYAFAFVRNPWDRLVSCWKNKIIRQSETIGIEDFDLEFKDVLLFKDFINKFISKIDIASCNHHVRPQFNLIFNDLRTPIIKPDFIGRIENFQEDFNIVCDKIGMPQQKLPHFNKSNHRHYTEYYDDETCEIVAKKFAKDIEYFGYEFG